MKTFFKIIFPITIFAILASTLMAFTFKATTDRKAAAREIQNYFQTNIAPVLKPQRKQFDKTLSESEKVEINKLRNEFREVMKFRKNNGITLVNSNPDNQTLYNEQQQKALKVSRDLIRKLTTRAWIIADQHQTEIDALLNPAKDKKQIWKSDIRKIMKNHAEERFMVLIPKRVLNRLDNLQIPEYFAPIAFVLWNPEEPIQIDEFLK